MTKKDPLPKHILDWLEGNSEYDIHLSEINWEYWLIVYDIPEDLLEFYIESIDCYWTTALLHQPLSLKFLKKYQNIWDDKHGMGIYNLANNDYITDDVFKHYEFEISKERIYV